MVRVLHVIDSLDLGGAQTALLNLLRYRNRARFHHEVAAMHGEGMFAAAFREIGVPVHSLAPHRWPPRYLVELPRLLERGRFDVVQCHLFGANWIAKPLAAACGVRCLYHHDQCNDAFRARNPAAVLVDTLTNHLSTRVLAVSRSVERFAREVEGLDPDRVTYFPNGVDLAEFRPGPVRHALGLPAEAFVIGGVGRFTRQKNFAVLIEAALPLLAAHPTAMLVLFGSGPEEPLLRALAAPAGNRVHFAGTVADRPAIYHGLDALVLPSRFEGLPLTVLEAMAAGVPVVASAVDGVREIATDGETALLVPPGDVAGFRRAINRLREDASLRTGLANRALALVRERFDARRLAAQLEALYERDLAALA